MTEFKEGDKVTVREGAVSLFGHRPDPNEVRTVNGPAASAGYIALEPSRSSAQANIFRAADLVPYVETPAPLDPSKVKAGDMVTLSRGTSSVIAKVTHVQGCFIHLEHLGRFRVKGLPSDRTWGHPEYTLIAHTPAPEPEPEWEPGTVADISVNFDTHRAIRAEIGVWRTVGNESFTDSRVDEVKPLVVIDPAEATAKEPHLIEWAVEVDTIGTKEIYDTEDEARAAADKYDLRLFRIEWMEVEK